MRVSVVGAGYVGLVSGACLAEKGHQVLCVDNDRKKVAMQNEAVSPVYERGLGELLRKNVPENLKATIDLHAAVLETDLTLIAVGTPFDGQRIDLSCVKKVATQIGKALRDKTGYHVVVVKSTVVPGTTENLVLPALEKASGKNAGVDFGVGMNPEFLREGEAVQDFLNPDRIILGGIDAQTIAVMEELYSVFEGVEKLKATPKMAEMIKYASNSLLATMISFSNEIGNLCAVLGGIDVVEVMRGVHLDKRLCPVLPTGDRIEPPFITYLEAGCGFGGSCFPKDVKALIAHGEQLGCPMSLLDAVIQVNEQQPYQILSLIKKHFPSLRGVRIAVLGLAFKKGTDDMRESPAIPIVRSLLTQGAQIKVYDPVAQHEARRLFGDHRTIYCENLQQAVRGVQVIVLLTRWEEFKQLPDMLHSLEPQPLFIDGRRMLDKKSVARYEGIGL